ncbi:glycoside hydrolase domain-containing protein [Weissella halotolerans]|uniref:Peptidoglycan binding domain protein n=1 Tax=Weissella halotolerans DSM 20190 TaxID=1123500 RepID=A0A0R2G220_9LACO|nr:glycoside hydrolase domain-containing protein [Weissella halotolerans]KRN33526.1 peptidoglycan binding domain protein [Weissella halotolerans DSM 20190]
MDQQVLDTQKWLNKTYSGVAGYQPVKENGLTGWPTIYALREGLQHEVGISPVASGFGSATEAGVSKVVGKLKVGYSGNLVRLVQGAFWAKGISPNAFDGKFTTSTENAIKELQSNAGLNASGTMTTELMKALFDMSAFTLVFGGKPNIRAMQQYLNGHYHKYFGILPCDGIYQRDTNTALIYALQVEIGLGSVANGYYGPGTINATPTLNVGASGSIVKILQYGLMVNGYYSGNIDGQFTSAIGSDIIAFRKFMNLPPYTSTADLTVIKGLLTSNGNVNRDASAMDTSKQLTASDVNALKAGGYKVIGRYLTGSVGTGTAKRNKYLTRSEISTITNAGIRIFPIYQDGGWDISYFTAAQGAADARAASLAASQLGFPHGTTIYFAADLDIENGNIAGTVFPYIKAVASHLSGYKVGIYGTRNVCSRATEETGVVTSSFVADMSTGFSGNLGFPMPKNWAFDQFVEFTLSGIPVDNLGMSGRDTGTLAFNKTISQKEAIRKVTGNFDMALDGPSVLMVNTRYLTVSAHASSRINTVGGSHAINITNGKFDSVSIGKALNVPTPLVDVALHFPGVDLTTDISEGEVHIGSISLSTGKVTIEVVVKSLKDAVIDAEFSLVFDVFIDKEQIKTDFKNAVIGLSEGAILTIAALIIVGLTGFAGPAGTTTGVEVAGTIVSLA